MNIKVITTCEGHTTRRQFYGYATALDFIASYDLVESCYGWWNAFSPGEGGKLELPDGETITMVVPRYAEMTRAAARGSIYGEDEAASYDMLADDILSVPFGIDYHCGLRLVDMRHPDERDDLLVDDYLRLFADREWAKRWVADRKAFRESGEADAVREAQSIREDERRMREDHERDIIRGLGGAWY